MFYVDSKIKVWNLDAALDPRTPNNTLCLQTLMVSTSSVWAKVRRSSTEYTNTGSYLLFQQHTGRVFRLQFDEFQIVSSSHDDTILIWDFLNYDEAEASSSNHTNTNNNNAVPLAMHANPNFINAQNHHGGLFRVLMARNRSMSVN